MERFVALLPILLAGCPSAPRQQGSDLSPPPDLIVPYDFALPDQATAKDLAAPIDLPPYDFPEQRPDMTVVDLLSLVDMPPSPDMALPKADLEVNYCIIQSPKMTTTKANVVSAPIYGQIYQAGLTDMNNGPAPGIVGQLGVGPQGTDPRISNAWTWVDAMPNNGWNFAQNNDEYVATLTVANVGGYSYAYRFSVTQRMGFTYCDTVGNGSNNGLPAFDPMKDGVLTVN